MRFVNRRQVSSAKVFVLIIVYILLAGLLLTIPTVSYPIIKANMKPEYRYSLMFPFDNMDYYGNDDAPDQVMYHVNLWNKSQVGKADITYITSSNAAFINVTNIRNITVHSRAIFKDECRRIFGFFWHDDTNYYKTYFLDRGMLRVNVTVLDQQQRIENLVLKDVPAPQEVRFAENDTEFTSYTYSGCNYTTSVPWSPCNMKVWFKPPPPPGIAPVPVVSVNRTCVHDNEPILFDASKSYDPDGQIVKYIWDFGDGNYSTNKAVESHQYTYNGSVTYGVYLLVIDNSSLINRTKLLIDVNKPDTEPPTAEAGPDISLTEDETRIFDGTNSYDNAGIVEYIWYFGDGSTALGPTQSHAYSRSGKYTVTLFVYDRVGYMGADVANVTVLNAVPVANAGPDREVGLKQPVNFNGDKSWDTPSDLPSLLYFWDYGDGSLGIGKTATHSYIVAGGYTVTLTVRDDDGAEGKDPCMVSVSNKTNQPPRLSPIPDVFVRLNYPWTFSLRPYVWDEDLNNLQVWTNSTYVNVSTNDNLILTFNYTNPNLLHDIVNVTVSDGEFAAYQQVNVTISLTDFPPRKKEGMHLPDITMQEDVQKPDVFNLNDYFVDNSTDVLNFTYLPNQHIFAAIQDGWVSLSSLTDWFGNTTMTFKAEDLAGAWVQETINVTVLSVNDPPVVLQQITLTSINEGSVWSIDLDDYFHDVDDANLTYRCSKLNITINPSTHEAQWVPGNGEYYLGNVIFTASDGEYNVSTRPTNITVVKRTITINPPLPMWLIVFIGVAFGISFVIFYRALRYRYTIEELFVLDRGGILLTHISPGKVKAIDKDIVGAMLTAVQQFVKDSFEKGKRRKKRGAETLEALEYGDLWIVIEEGKYIHLAVVISGYDNPGLRAVMKKVIREIEVEYGKTLRVWDGDMGKLKGIKKIAGKLAKKEKVGEGK